MRREREEGNSKGWRHKKRKDRRQSGDSFKGTWFNKPATVKQKGVTLLGTGLKIEKMNVL